MGKRIKRVTMFHADRSPFADAAAVLRRLRARDLVSIGSDQVIAVYPGAAADEDLDPEERETIYRLLGYEAPDPNTPLIARRVGVLGGRAAVAGTRIPVWQVALAHRRGVARQDLRMEYGLSDEQIDQAIAYAEAHTEEIDFEIFENERLADLAGAGSR